MVGLLRESAIFAKNLTYRSKNVVRSFFIGVLYRKRLCYTWVDMDYPDDHILLQRLLTQDERALKVFYNQHKKPLMQFIGRSLQEDDAEEVLQDTFFGFIESLRNFRGQSSLKTFLYSIAKRKIIDRMRRKKIQRVLFSYLPSYVVETLATVLLQDTVDKGHIAKKISRVFHRLPNDYAHVLRLKYIEGYKVSKIGIDMGLSLKAVESLLFRARKAFAALYADYDRSTIFTIEEKV